MDSVLDLCKPREELLAGYFNPEIFTATLRPVVDHYRDLPAEIDSVYTDAHSFFQEATHPTKGLRTILSEVFARLAGEATAPALHRLETAFGGGKTHALIACTHIAKKGNLLADETRDLLPPQYLPEPDSISLVGIAGDEIPVHKPRGEELIPYTLWGEIAFQVGGEELYRAVEDEATSYAAPGKNYFDQVFSGSKTLVMLDELAQYAARLEAARPDGASQLAAFIMGLHGYARNRPGIAILLTLASSTDAFAHQTQQLATLITEVQGQSVSETEALGIGERAVEGLSSVVARDAVPVTPVQAEEISSILGQRLFTHIDRTGAQASLDEYMDMYKRNSSALPEEAIRPGYRDTMERHYPFHPTLVDFLNHKLAAAENFQGTRGVLRVLSLAVRRIWETQQAVPMLHTCHLDLRSERVVNEILGRTESSDLYFIINADLGGVDTEKLEGGRSNAELADQANPHPQKYRLYEYTWKTVFLHSLVGREKGLASNIFGISEPEALFAVSFPGLTPTQIKMALEEISRSAFYLRCEDGRYYASAEPTINSVLARIRKSVNQDDVEQIIKDAARKVISTEGRADPFQVEHDVELPEHLPDHKERPLLGIVSIAVETINVENIITTRGPNKPREHQNLVFLLVPDTVQVNGHPVQKAMDFQDTTRRDSRQRVEQLARQVKAMRVLCDKPQNYAVNPQQLQAKDFKDNYSITEHDLLTSVSTLYTRLFFSSTDGGIVQREIRTAGGEGGAPFIEQVRQLLEEERKLLTNTHTTEADLVNLRQLFFSQSDTVTLALLRHNFYCLRSWPVLADPGVLDQIVRAGVQKGHWCVYRMGEAQETQPQEFYHQDDIVPLSTSLSEPGYGLVTISGAKQRGWGESKTVDPDQVKKEIVYAIGDSKLANWQQVQDMIASKHSGTTLQELDDYVLELAKKEEVYLARGEPEEGQTPDLIYGSAALLYQPQGTDLVVTPSYAAEKGWITKHKNHFTLKGEEAIRLLWPTLARLGSIYNKGAKSTIRALDMQELELPQGGKLRLELSQVKPEDMRALGELFETLAGLVQTGDQTDIFLEITDPEEDCLLLQEIGEKTTQGGQPNNG